jgi:hypothetical protein
MVKVMRMYIFLFFLLIICLTSPAQNAVDFTCNDCNGASHCLFTELDTGIVVVLCWVMPCGGCIATSCITNQVVQSFDSVYPGRVRMYLADDFANNSCASLDSWAEGNNITGITTFSDAAIKMSDYGLPGMPKVVVVAGKDHRVYYNVSSGVNETVLKDSIFSAFRDYSAGIDAHMSTGPACSIYPNPASGSTILNLLLNNPDDISVSIFDPSGRLVLSQLFTGLGTGENRVRLNTEGFPSGTYVVRVAEGRTTTEQRLIICR